MRNERRHDPSITRPDYERGARYQGGRDRDRYRTGNEQRYWPERESGQGAGRGGYEGQRAYPQGGYREEIGYSEFDMPWSTDTEGEPYYGAGGHYGGGFGTAPSTRASSLGTRGAFGYAGHGAWSDPADWTPQDEGDASSAMWREPASHRGRGPKGYLRSDERLLESICERLTDDPHIDASDIEVEVRDQVVTLRGSIDQRRTKYAVEELAERCGAREINNELRVTGNQR